MKHREDFYIRALTIIPIENLLLLAKLANTYTIEYENDQDFWNAVQVILMEEIPDIKEDWQKRLQKSYNWYLTKTVLDNYLGSQ